VLITNHVLSGAVLGWLAPSVPAAAATGFASHFALDAVPHFGVADPHFLKVAVPDGLLGLAAIGVVAATTPRHRRLRVLAGIAGACLPDLDKPSRQFTGRSPFPAWFDRGHSRLQRESPSRFGVELAAAATFATLLAAFSGERVSRRRPGPRGAARR
jgi:hypothetical protein